MGAIFYFVLCISSGSSCWLSLWTWGDLECVEWVESREFSWSPSFSTPYLVYFLKGSASIGLEIILLSWIGLFEIGDGEYCILLSVLEDKSAPLPGILDEELE